MLIVVTRAQRRGAEIEAENLAGHLSAIGMHVDLVALSGDGAAATTALGSRPLSRQSLRRLRRAGRASALVIAYGSSTLPACALSLAGTGVPFVYRSIGNPADWVRSRLHRRRTQQLFRRAAHVITLWPGASDAVERLYGVRRERITAIPNARDPASFPVPSAAARSDARSVLGLDDDDDVVLMLGALSPEKQVTIAVEAVRQLPDVRLVVAGDGPERRALEAAAAESSPGQVRILGTVDDATQVLFAADALVLTSRTEGMPGAIIEAGLCGVPAVAPAIGAIDQLIADGATGVLLRATDPEHVAESLRVALRRRRELGAGARERMTDRYSWDTVLPAWLELIASIAPASAVEPSDRSPR